MPDLDVEIVEPLDYRLGRQKVHDPESRSFAMGLTVDKTAWTTKLVRIYDPTTNPNQCHGECTGCSNAMMLNSEGNRVANQVLNMNYAHKVYSIASYSDPWPGGWQPDDTGSSGLAAAKAAQKLGTGGEYRWLLGGADEVVQSIMQGRVVSVGTSWYEGMMNKDAQLNIAPTGQRLGGHQYTVRGYDKSRDSVVIRCWWGSFRDAYLKRSYLNDLLMAGGDAYVQDRRPT